MLLHRRTCTFVKIENAMKTVNSLPPPEECNCFAVRAAARHVSQSYDRFLAPTGLRTTQYSILARLKRKGPLTINALAEAMVMDRTTLGRNVLPLQRDGLIKIKSAASDRRAKELRLTKAGESRLQHAREGWSQAQARFEAPFGDDRAAHLLELLRPAPPHSSTPPPTTPSPQPP